MPYIKCPCGHDISMTQLPSPYEFLVVAQAAVQAVVNDLVKLHTDPNEKHFELRAYAAIGLRQPRFPSLVECPKCFRLLLFESGASAAQIINVYRPEPIPICTEASLRSLFPEKPKGGEIK